MKKQLLFITTLLLALISPPIAAAQTCDVMAVRMADGGSHYFLLATDPQVTYVGDDMVVYTPGTDTRVSYPIAEIFKIWFIDEASVDEISTDNNITISFDDSTLRVGGLTPGTQLTVHDTKGVEHVRLTVPADGQVTVDIAHLVRGVYLVSAPGLSTKLLR